MPHFFQTMLRFWLARKLFREFLSLLTCLLTLVSCQSLMIGTTSSHPSAFPIELEKQIPVHCQQLITVVANDLQSTNGHLWLLERDHAEATWQSVHRPIPVTLGRGGLALAQEFQSVTSLTKNLPLKREGDQRSPLGIFRIPFAFGSDPAPKTTMPYEIMTPHHAGIDDPHSRNYNQIVDRRKINVIDWSSHENMLPSGGSYELALFVDYNANHIPHAGSCIFIHIWLKPGEPTSGCTAMSKSDLLWLLSQLHPHRHPHLLQYINNL